MKEWIERHKHYLEVNNQTSSMNWKLIAEIERLEKVCDKLGWSHEEVVKEKHELEDKITQLTAIVEKYQKYIKLLKTELDEVVLIACNYGWRSRRIEEGKNMRMEIDKSLAKLKEAK